MDENLLSINMICRICLKKLPIENTYGLFTIPGLAKKLNTHTTLAVEPDDGFPQNICGICYNRLNDMQEFQKMCDDSMQKLQEMLANNLICGQTSELAVVEAAEMDPQHDGIDEDEPIYFDPLLNNKLEVIANSEEVFKMIENVDKEVRDGDVTEAVAIKSSILDVPSVPQSDDSDFEPPAYVEGANASSDDSRDYYEKPLAARLIKSRQSKKVLRQQGIIEDGLNADAFEAFLKKKRAIKNKTRSAQQVGDAQTAVPGIECHICQKRFRKTERYDDHMRHHNDKLPHQCSVEACLKGFTTANGLRLHMEHCHAETCDSYPCPEDGCGRTFPRTRLLNWHLRKVHKIAKDLREQKCFKCSQCDKVFRCPMALKKHMYKHDGKELPFPCNICGKRFVINSALKDHLMRHAGIKNYVCPYCGVGKTTRQEWNTHVNTHTQEKKFNCTQCTYASHNKQNLRMHVKIVHEKIKDYACQYCGKQFGKSNACKMHEMTHTGEKRCECKVCGKRFLYAKALTKHLKTHEKRVLRAIEVYRKRQIENGFMIDDAPEVPIPELSSTVESHSQESHQKVAEEILKVCAESTATIPRNPRRVERVDIAELAGESRSSSLQSDEIAVHSRNLIGESRSDKSAKEEPFKELHKARSHSTDSSSSPERFQKNDCINTKISICGDSSSARPNETNKSIGGQALDKKDVNKRRSASTHRRKTPENIPYFIDEVRERDRRRRKCGIVADKTLSITSSSSSRRSRSTSRTRHTLTNRDRTRRHRFTSRDRYASEAHERYREKLKSDKTKYSKHRHRSEDREGSRHRHRSLNSSSRSRSASRERNTRSRHIESSRNERPRYRHANHGEASNADFIQTNLPQTQIITIPVPVPTDFLNYPYSAWPAPTQWNPHLAQPPRYGARAAFPILPATVIPPIRPPLPLYGLPHPSMHYGGRGIRFRPNRTWHQSFRGRNS